MASVSEARPRRPSWPVSQGCHLASALAEEGHAVGPAEATATPRLFSTIPAVITASEPSSPGGVALTSLGRHAVAQRACPMPTVVSGSELRAPLQVRSTCTAMPLTGPIDLPASRPPPRLSRILDTQTPQASIHDLRGVPTADVPHDSAHSHNAIPARLALLWRHPGGDAEPI